ncbi:hypothetical protein HG537_0A04630 [Torulaspora globosa]|uniref:Cytochrome b5 heme-binding domain-containing protein n=1 Tax=Torulaspora globosa TaxID=48254 RepID=A0A7H9HLM2_9SACH|nr:hypothetical protein HG537_0A04630 [Torulaspora sp. CBS 2947]
MDEPSNPIANRVARAKDALRRPIAPRVQRMLAVPSGSNLTPELNQTESSELAIQAGCSTLGAGGYRSKVRLKPGHSALDWHELASGKGKRQGLVVGIEKLLNEDFERLQHLNHPQSLMQLQRGVPTYMIKPPLRIDKELLQKHSSLNDCWCVIRGNVYCLTYYFDFHPGGVDILIKNCAGKDGTKAFEKYHRWVSFDKLLETCLVGVYVT